MHMLPPSRLPILPRVARIISLTKFANWPNYRSTSVPGSPFNRSSSNRHYTCIFSTGTRQSFVDTTPRTTSRASQPSQHLHWTSKSTFSRRIWESRCFTTTQIGSYQYDAGDSLNNSPQNRNTGRFIRIVEVSPRDGLQNIPGPAVPTAIKVELVQRLLAAGLRNIEVGSFVRGDRVPQMADTTTLLPLLPVPSTIPPVRPIRTTSPISNRSQPPPTIPIPSSDQTIHYPVLVPNMRGLDNLLSLESSHRSKGGQRLTDEIAVFVSSTEAFSQANNGAPIEKILSALPSVISKAADNGYRTRGYVSCVITCPYSGVTPVGQVVDVAEKLLGMGCYEVSLGDTTGEGNPEAWRVLWEGIKERGLPIDEFAAHCHDTFSLALSSILTLLPLGLRTIDSSLAGLGGCPYSPGATGNVPTEDVVYALHKLGYETGVDLDKLVEAGQWLTGVIGVRNESRVGRAMWARRRVEDKKAREEGRGKA